MSPSLTPKYLSPDDDPSSAAIATQLDFLEQVDRADLQTRRKVVESLDTLDEMLIGRRGRDVDRLRERIKGLHDDLVERGV